MVSPVVSMTCNLGKQNLHDHYANPHENTLKTMPSTSNCAHSSARSEILGLPKLLTAPLWPQWLLVRALCIMCKTFAFLSELQLLIINNTPDYGEHLVSTSALCFFALPMMINLFPNQIINIFCVIFLSICNCVS